jgi:hypothetical protein
MAVPITEWKFQGLIEHDWLLMVQEKEVPTMYKMNLER